jgi:hypothetical protein
MSIVNEQDKEIEATLQRVATHLSHRGSEYLEHPMTEQVVAPGRNSQKRRLLVGTVAAATLTVTALAGSFIGGSSSGKVDVAKAAWSAVPVPATKTQTNELDALCKPMVHQQFDAYVADHGADESVPVAVPELVASDVRGASASNLYFARSYPFGVFCAGVREGGSGGAIAVGIDMFGGDGEPVAKNGTVAQRSFKTKSGENYALFVGYLPNGEASKYSATIFMDPPAGEQVPEAVIATIDETWGRYYAWVPRYGNGHVTFFNKSDGEPVGSINLTDTVSLEE